MSEEEYNNTMIEAFIDKPEKTLWYQMAFKKYDVNGVDSMRWNWSWWAFFGGWGFLLYRKQYLASALIFVLSMLISFIPFAGFILSTFIGGFGTYIIYKGYKTKLSEVEANVTNIKDRIETMRQIGGYNQWVIWVYATFVTIAFIGIISSLILPYFNN